MCMAKKKDEKDESLKEYIIRSAESKKKTPQEWWESNIENMGKSQFRLATHVGKFTHPDSTVALLAKQEEEKGFVTTSSCSIDVLTPAQYIGAASLLLKEMPGGKTVLECMESGRDSMAAELRELALPEKELSTAFAALHKRSGIVPDETDERLKQVYFPISENRQYHLLTILPASSQLLEMKNRIWQMQMQRIACHSKESECYGEDHEDILNLTEVGFGGTKPQNISALNSRARGTAYLLPSLPPTLTHRDIRPPKRDFFRETVGLRAVKSSMYMLHKLFTLPRNNKAIRDRIRKEVDALADRAVVLAAGIREEEPGWSDGSAFQNLPKWQKIWLDAAYEEERLADQDWISEAGTAFGRWLLFTYEKYVGKGNAVILGDIELGYFRRELIDILREEVRIEK